MQMLCTNNTAPTTSPNQNGTGGTEFGHDQCRLQSAFVSVSLLEGEPHAAVFEFVAEEAAEESSGGAAD